jgi:Icc-related predicted phosphoesterase
VPPRGIRDFEDGQNVGSQDLLERVLMVDPVIHVFGHVHEEYGYEKRDGTIFVNAAICDVGHKPIRKPLSLEI